MMRIYVAVGPGFLPPSICEKLAGEEIEGFAYGLREESLSTFHRDL